MSNEWLNDLEKQLKIIQVKNVEPNKVVNPITTVSPAPKSSLNNLFLTFLIFLFFFLVTTGLFSFANNWNENSMKSLLNPLVSQDEKLQNKINWCEDRIFVLGVVNVHNHEVIKRNLPKEDLIVIDENWKINRYPDLLKFDERSETIIRRFLK